MNSAEIIQRHDALMREVERMNEQRNRSVGKLEQLQKQLDDDGFKSFEEAGKFIDAAKKENLELNNKITELLDKAEKLLDKF